jgi:hypothetical protein
MKKTLTLMLGMIPTALFSQNETLDLRHQLSFDKLNVQNTIRFEGIRCFDLTDSRSIFINGNFDAVYGQNFATSWGAGLREYFSQFGLGINAYWDFSNEAKIGINQIGFGFEFLLDKFTFFHNRSLPLTKDKSTFLYKVSFANSSSIGFKHLIRPDFYYSLSANFREDCSRIGGRLDICKQFDTGFTLGAFVHYEGSVSPLYGFSLGYHFGGKKPLKYQKPVRDHEVKYRITHAQVKQKENTVIITPPASPADEKKNGPDVKPGWISRIFN